MVIKDIRHECSFIATDSAGKEHMLHVYRAYIDAGTKDDPNATLSGLASIKTDDGNDVNRIEKGRYEIVGSGTELTSSDPDAP